MLSTRSVGSLVAAIAVLCLTISPAFSAQRVVLFEEFTNWGCPPCATTDPIIEGVLSSFGDQVSAVKWHVNWPSVDDPFHLYNSIMSTRRSYYGISGVPDVLIGGQNNSDPFSATSMTNVINARLAIPSPLAITASGEVAGGMCNFTVEVDVEVAQAAADHRLFVTLVENYRFFAGPNGAPHHRDAFRWANNSNTATGAPIDLTVTGTQTFNYSFPFDAGYHEDQMSVRVWVQDYTTREPLQAALADLTIPYIVEIDLDGPDSQIGDVSEVVSFNADLSNLGTANDTYDITVTGVPAGWAYSYTTPAGTFSGPSTLDVDSQSIAAISLSLDSQGLAGMGTVTLDIQSQGDLTKNASLQFQKINGAQVILVDDDGGGTRETFVEDMLSAAGVVHGTWDKTFGDLTTAQLEIAGEVVLWIEGDQLPTLTEADRLAISGLLDNGGKLFISGQEIGYDLMDPFSPNYEPATIIFYTSYLHSIYTNTGPNSYFVDGVTGDPIGDGLLHFGLQGGTAGNAQSIHDAIQPLGADLIFTYENGFGAGIKWTDGNAQLVYLAFGYEGIFDPTVRLEVLNRVLAWFGVETTGVAEPAASAPSIVSLAQNTPNPFRPSTSISYRLADEGAVSLRVFDVAGRVVRELVSGNQSANSYTVHWDGKDHSGNQVSSGVYFYRLETAAGVETRRMVLTR